MIIESLLTQAAQQPDEIAIIDETGSHSYRKVAGMTAALAGEISRATQRPDVGLLLPSGIGYVASFYGILWAGKSVVPINFLLSPREIAHVIADSGIDTVITIAPLAARLIPKDSPLRVIDLASWQPPTTPIAPLPVPAAKADDMAVLMYTSGTSGLPKGVILTYGNLQSDVDDSIVHAQLRHKHKFLGVIPLFHTFGMMASMLAPIQLGTTVIYLARFNALAVFKAIAEQGVSLVFAVPSMYAAMLQLKTGGPADFANVYALLCGGEPLPATIAQAFKQRFGQPILEGYGLTETSPVISLNTPQHQRLGSVGIPLPTARVRIISEDGADQPVGETGEVWLAGPMVAKGYYHLPKETAETFTPEGFFKTGDLGRLDSDGYLYIVGRKKELIIVAGEKAVPREIEEAIAKHPAVAEAAVVGKKDAARGEVVVAFLTLREEIPRDVFIETDLPRSPTGKILKRVLAERVNKGYVSAPS
ncbi:MAG: AMP-binding protein [Tepidisphaeraceae bacterium]